MYKNNTSCAQGNKGKEAVFKVFDDDTCVENKIRMNKVRMHTYLKTFCACICMFFICKNYVIVVCTYVCMYGVMTAKRTN